MLSMHRIQREGKETFTGKPIIIFLLISYKKIIQVLRFVAISVGVKILAEFVTQLISLYDHRESFLASGFPLAVSFDV